MLHDPRHDKTPSLAGFALFVASREPSERYDWPNCQECAVGQYLRSLGHEIDLSHWRHGTVLGTMNCLAGGSADLFEERNGRSAKWTFGALADRILDHQMSRQIDELAFTD